MGETFYNIIYSWVEQNFGPHEAQDPSWNIEALADHLSDSDIDPDELSAMTKTECYRAVERHYLEEDCDTAAEDMGVELTDKERSVVVDEFMNSEAYVGAHAEDWEWFIKQELKHREGAHE